ncbi:hypothetical protein BO78DRAFT_408816 [Aspergillus sclerotiicarbonarius CBS 121057]|uniref:Uncharacterized protein n=1 Tax=Aspergillus sclerotiicarbonarius (strain CBS 121057 / IBT 28362) TaxID=1448318 RepID=A0A319E413_ASPSB|nr:hypothetical protein BO78DRAFT_408816 [Aspergillus sclerotiicarbonarius CBS 121057]
MLIVMEPTLTGPISAQIPLFRRPRAHNYRIDVEGKNQTESYFMKVSIGNHGREFESTSAIHAIVGDFIPQPMGWELPEPAGFCEKIALLHSKNKSGFHVATYNGDLPQDNGYADTWEELFTKGSKHMINMNIQRGGPWVEMEGLDATMIEKVIPRLLRPMETARRSITPSLVASHPDELDNWRPERHKFSKSYFNAYHSHIPKSASREDYDYHNALHSM